MWHQPGYWTDPDPAPTPTTVLEYATLGFFIFFSKLQSKSKTQGISGGVSFFNFPRQRAEDFINIYFLTALC